MATTDVQLVRDNSPNVDASSSFFHGCSEGKRFKVLEVIGKGSYGTVCAAIDNATGEKVAIKRIQNVFDNVADATRILREIKLLRILKHPDVVDIKHIMLPPDPRTFKDIFVVFELMESDLHTVIGANDDLTAGK
jgi:serine/threonine protein kinase